MAWRGRRCAVILASAVAVVALHAQNYASASTDFAAGFATGTVQNTSITEASGIVASRINQNVLWTHNDSGHPAQVFAMTAAGTDLGTYNISGASNTDWEDIALGPGPASGAQYLYIGDIGDNNAVRSSISVYRVPEPSVSDVQSTGTFSVSGAVKLSFVYPDGARNAESMFVDPLTKDIYIISKFDQPKHLYRAPYPQSTSGTTTLQLMTTFPTDSTWLTAADISSDGNEIIVRSTAATSGRMYVRPTGGTITDAFNATPLTIPLVSETQGEAIGFDPNSWGYFTTSEGSNQPINYFNRLPPPGEAHYWDNDGMPAGSHLATGAGIGGSGTWDSTSAKWYNGGADVPWVSGNDAVFAGTTGTVTLSSAQSVNSLSFKSNGYLLSGSTLTLSGSSVSVDGGATATIKSAVAGSAGLVKNGLGTLLLESANSFSGATTINGGVLGVVSNALGQVPTSPVLNITINNGSTLRIDTNGLTLAANRQILLGTGGGIIDTNGNNDTIAGIISGSSLTKVGNGTLALNNVNIYSGATVIDAGILSASASANLGNGGASNNISLNGGTLKTTGAFSSNRKISIGAAGGTIDTGGFDSTWGDLDPGNFTKNGAGKLSVRSMVAGNVTINGGELAVQNRAATGGNQVARMSALSVNPSAALDLNDNDLVVNTGSFAAIQALVFQGYRQGADPGATGIISTTGQTSIGSPILALFDNALVGSSDYPFGSGQTISANAVVGKYTYFGDTNLDGQVTADDYGALDANFGASSILAGKAWLVGDTNFDGTVTADDYGTLDANFGLGAGNPLGAEGVAAVPEVGGTTLVALGAIGLWGRRGAGARRRRGS